MKEPTIASDGVGVQAHSKNYRDTYVAYIQSDHWRNLREQALIKAGYCCEACHGKRPLDGHHLIYRDPLESGVVDDIMALCRICHDVWHDWLDANGKKPHYFNRSSTAHQIREILKGSKDRPSDGSFENHIALHLTADQLASYNRFLASAPPGGVKAKRNYAIKRVEKLHKVKLKFLRSVAGGKRARKNTQNQKPKPKAAPWQPAPKYNITVRPKIDILEDVVFDYSRVILKLEQRIAALENKLSTNQ